MRVLIVEDDEMPANTLIWMAEEFGDKARVCYTGRDAITTAHATRPDLMVVDMILPDMEGTEVVDRYAAIAKRPAQPLWRIRPTPTCAGARKRRAAMTSLSRERISEA